MYAITVFGDSITFGRGDTLEGGWLGRLKKEFESKDSYNCIYNLGICGNTSYDLLKRFEIEAKARVTFIRKGDRQVIIIAIGINDSRLRGKDNPQTKLDDFNRNLRLIIEKAKSYTEDLLFIGLTPVDESKTKDYEGTSFTNERIERYNNAIKEICSIKDIPFFDMYQEFSKIEYEKLLGDGLHPNAEGYEIMFTMIKEFLEKNNVL